MADGCGTRFHPIFYPAFTPVQPELFGGALAYSNAWADFDSDGDLDVAVSIKGGAIALYRNDGARFVDVGPAMGLAGADGGEFRGLSWADFDDDGRIDLYAGSSLAAFPSRLYRNLGDRFADVAPALGAALPGRSSRQNNLLDFDGDGDLDLFATDRLGTNKLLRNDDGRFVQILAGAPISAARSTVGACRLDYDRDGDLDLFLANQSGKQDALFRNNGSGFVDVAVELGINTPGRASNEGGVGCAIGDLNNDGFLDVFVPNYGRNALWLGQPGGRFVACAAAAGVDIDNHAVGAAIGDLDNDGRMDLSVMAYHGVPGAQVPEHQLFHNQGGGRLRNVLAAGSPLNAGDHGTALVDFDGDGGLDLSITKGYNRIGGHFLFRSGLPPRRARQSLQVIVLDAGGHHREAGAEVRVFAPNGRLIGTAQVHTGGGYGVQHAMPVHFGLGSVRHVTVEVTFMHKSGRKVQRITNVRPAVRPIIVRRNPA